MYQIASSGKNVHWYSVYIVARRSNQIWIERSDTAFRVFRHCFQRVPALLLFSFRAFHCFQSVPALLSERSGTAFRVVTALLSELFRHCSQSCSGHRSSGERVRALFPRAVPALCQSVPASVFLKVVPALLRAFRHCFRASGTAFRAVSPASERSGNCSQELLKSLSDVPALRSEVPALRSERPALLRAVRALFSERSGTAFKALRTVFRALRHCSERSFTAYFATTSLI
ncbi:hypothetical protein AVEN_180345-1 [Araneus ventricosus]|uniref:Uncharacterized protein n=1 Tax=Araneus ventricosus TaxID=182803 RepID=A0A4Y2T425_ARAVE|nr:hypothetical protein AVEN_180345-1 [Araneus ventricosus]